MNVKRVLEVVREIQAESPKGRDAKIVIYANGSKDRTKLVRYLRHHGLKVTELITATRVESGVRRFRNSTQVLVASVQMFGHGIRLSFADGVVLLNIVSWKQYVQALNTILNVPHGIELSSKYVRDLDCAYEGKEEYEGLCGKVGTE